MHQFLTNACVLAKDSWRGSGMDEGDFTTKPECDLVIKKPIPADCEVNFDFQPFADFESGVYVGKTPVTISAKFFNGDLCHRVTLEHHGVRPQGAGR